MSDLLSDSSGDSPRREALKKQLLWMAPCVCRVVWRSKDAWDGRGKPPAPQLLYATQAFVPEGTVSGWLVDDPVTLPLDKGRWSSAPVFRERISLDWIAEAEAVDDERAREVTEALDARVFRRLRGDRVIRYGDGGRSDLFYPVLAARSLGVSQNRRSRMARALLRLDALKNDVQEERPWIHDIVDPDLRPFLDSEWRQKRVVHIEQQLEARRGGFSLRRELRFELDDLKADIEANAPPRDFDQMRRGYSWVPAIFKVSQDDRVNITTPINNLPVCADTEDIYRGLASAFSKMLPAFRELGLASGPQELRVVVKAQRYVLEPNTSYSGRWHREGIDDECVAVGVYYCDIGQGLEGGSLKFRPDEPPTPGYARDIEVDLDVPVETDSAVVFANDIVHRFRAIRNCSRTPQQRLFVNFFLMNPRVDTPPVSATAGEIIVLLAKRFRVPRDIFRLIFKYFKPYGCFWPSLPEAKAYRAKVKAGMMAKERGWGYINWGNCGTIKYIPDGRNHPYDTRQVEHTDSGADDRTE